MFSFGQVIDRPTERSYRAARATICIYIVAVLSLLPFSSTRIAEIPDLTSTTSAVVLTTDFSSGFLLLVMFHALRRASLLILACAYLYAASMALMNLLTIPGVLLPHGLAHNAVQSTGWNSLLFWVGYGFLCFTAMILECSKIPPIQQQRVGLAIRVSLVLILSLIIVIGVVVTSFVEFLPLVLQGHTFDVATDLPRVVSIVIMLVTAALGLFVAGRRSSVFLWLSLAVAATACVSILIFIGGARSSLGWLLGRVSWMISACVLFLFFLGQFVRQMQFLAGARDALDQIVQERTAELTRALRQRDLLLREVYHRVKNNMQVVDSILFLEARRIVDPSTKAMIQVLRHRVFALGLVHEQMMSSNNMEYFDIAPFLEELVQTLGIAESVQERGIHLHAASDAVLVNLDIGIPIALLATELVTNSIKHSRTQQILITFRRFDDGNASFIVMDDGSDSDVTDLGVEPKAYCNEHRNLIIAGLVDQLDGMLKVTRDGGMRVEIILPIPEMRHHDSV